MQALGYPLKDFGIEVDSVLKALCEIKKAAAVANLQCRLLDEKIALAVMRAADEFLKGKFEEDFALSRRQSISGTQTNMNVNEALADRASELLGYPVHPRHHVNKSQNSLDVFPSATHIAAWKAVDGVVSFVRFLQLSLTGKAEKYLKQGEVNDWARMLDRDIPPLQEALRLLSEITLGDPTSTKLVAAKGDFNVLVRAELTRNTGVPVSPVRGKTQVLSNKGELKFVLGAVKSLATDLLEISQNAHGNRTPSGHSHSLPSSSSALRTQIEDTDQMIAFMSGEGKLALNIYVPDLAYNFLRCCHLLADEISSLYSFCRSAVS
ncbi:MAG: hypothetical protein LBO68_02845 [Synergistaceae bacterium]|jgi:fumarate hydratase class II|nr:hypothetical protein [Synergistaceae bacterium]